MPVVLLPELPFKFICLIHFSCSFKAIEVKKDSQRYGCFGSGDDHYKKRCCLTVKTATIEAIEGYEVQSR